MLPYLILYLLPSLILFYFVNRLDPTRKSDIAIMMTITFCPVLNLLVVVAVFLLLISTAGLREGEK